MEPRRTSPLKGLLDAIRAMVSGSVPVRPILLVGGIGVGKTSAGLRLTSLLRRSGISPGGVLAPRILEGDETVGYSLIDLSTQTTHPFASLEPSDVKIGRFRVSTAGLDLANRAIGRAARERAVTLVDEVGRLELGGGGHAPALRSLLSSSSVPILLVRDEFVDDVIRTFGLKDPMLYDVTAARDPSLAREAGVEILWRIVDSVPFPLLVTIAEDAFPASRPMTLVDRNEGTLWFATSRGSRKVAHIEANPSVTVLFVDTTSFNYASLYGRARLVDDPEREAAVWRDDWRDDWPEGPSDPDYVLLRVDVTRGQYLRGSTGESGAVGLAAPAA
jgi:general stress protein 26/nucleoside-triphosphatase THEP1